MIKTYKRETALAMLAGVALLCVTGLYAGDDMALEWAKLLVPPVFLFAAGAFGLDAVAKQLPRRGAEPPEYG